MHICASSRPLNWTALCSCYWTAGSRGARQDGEATGGWAPERTPERAPERAPERRLALTRLTRLARCGHVPRVLGYGIGALEPTVIWRRLAVPATVNGPGGTQHEDMVACD